MPIIQPSYNAGYARYKGESQFPNLWDGLVACYDPGLGPTGGTLYDHAGRKLDGTLTNMAPSSDWVVSDRGWALDLDGTNDEIVFPRFNFGSSSWEVPGGFTNTGLDYDSTDGALWVGDFTNSKLIKTTLNGAKLGEVSITGQPQGVAYDSSDDTLWWADNSGETLRHINKDGSDAGGSITLGFEPNGCAYEAATDSIWVVEEGTDNVKRYSCSDGTLQETLVVASTIADGLGYHAGTDRLWLSDDTGSKIYEVNSSTGAIISTFTGLQVNIEDIAFVGDDLYYCADSEFHSSIPSGNRVFNLASKIQFSLALRAKISTPASTKCLIAKGNPVSGVGFGLYMLSSGQIRMFIRDGKTSVTADRTISSGWHSLGFVGNQYSGEMALFIDGVQSGATVSIATVTKCAEVWNRLSIGNGVDGDIARFYATQASGLNCFSRALTSAEIQQLYLGASPLTLRRRKRFFVIQDAGQNLTTTPAIFDWVSKDATLTLGTVDLTADPAVVDWVAKDASITVGTSNLSTDPSVVTWVSKDSVAVPDSTTISTTPAVVQWTANDATIPGPAQLDAEVAIFEWIATNATATIFVPPNPPSSGLSANQCATRARASRAGGGTQATRIMPCSPSLARRSS